MSAINLLLGTVALLLGRRLYWVFIAIAGFLIGLQLAVEFLVDQPPWVQVACGIGVGVVGALLAIGTQRLLFAIAGFYAVGYLAVALGEILTPGAGPAVWFIAGGVLGAVIGVIALDPALIVFSSLFGAACITAELVPSSPMGAILFLVLFVIGVGVQFQSLPQADRGWSPRDRRTPRAT